MARSLCRSGNNCHGLDYPGLTAHSPKPSGRYEPAAGRQTPTLTRSPSARPTSVRSNQPRRNDSNSPKSRPKRRPASHALPQLLDVSPSFSNSRPDIHGLGFPPNVNLSGSWAQRYSGCGGFRDIRSIGGFHFYDWRVRGGAVRPKATLRIRYADASLGINTGGGNQFGLRCRALRDCHGDSKRFPSNRPGGHLGPLLWS